MLSHDCVDQGDMPDLPGICCGCPPKTPGKVLERACSRWPNSAAPAMHLALVLKRSFDLGDFCQRPIMHSVIVALAGEKPGTDETSKLGFKKLGITSSSSLAI